MIRCVASELLQVNIKIKILELDQVPWQVESFLGLETIQDEIYLSFCLLSHEWDSGRTFILII